MEIALTPGLSLTLHLWCTIAWLRSHWARHIKLLMLAGQTQIMLARAQYVEFWLHPLLTLGWGAPGSFGSSPKWA